MDCCNEYGKCTQGHNCPVRALKQASEPAKGKPVPLSTKDKVIVYTVWTIDLAIVIGAARWVYMTFFTTGV